MASDAPPTLPQLNRLQQRVDELLTTKTETRNSDYKAAMSFPRKGTAERYDILRDIMAFANTPDGGDLLIGVDNRSRKAQSLTRDQVATWDTTVIYDALVPYASPLPAVRPHPVELGGALFVLLVIEEFDRIPIVCKDSSPPPPKVGGTPTLRRGGIYIRTLQAQTVEIADERDMRTLIERATLKSGGHILSQIQQLFDMHGAAASAPPPVDPYAAEIHQALEDMGKP